MKRKFLLTEAEAMVPYVRTLLEDLTAAKARTVHWERRVQRFGTERTGEARLTLSMALRERDWAVAALDAAVAELAVLGVRLLDPVLGAAGFPFRWSRNRRSRRIRQAMFLIKLDDDPARGIHTWRFTGEDEVRRVPPHWLGQMESPILAEVGA